jgi:Spy/CpxP family protein refolding chaperone
MDMTPTRVFDNQRMLTMNTAMKAIMTGLIVTGIGATALTVRADEPDSLAERMEHRKAELHDKLKLKPEQEQAWNTFVEKMKPAQPMERPDREDMKKLPAPDRMARMLDMMKAHESRMENRLAAVKEFYGTLTPEQQKVFDEETARRFSRRSGAMRHDRRQGTGADGP